MSLNRLIDREKINDLYKNKDMQLPWIKRMIQLVLFFGKMSNGMRISIVVIACIIASLEIIMSDVARNKNNVILDDINKDLNEK